MKESFYGIDLSRVPQEEPGSMLLLSYLFGPNGPRSDPMDSDELWRVHTLLDPKYLSLAKPPFSRSQLQRLDQIRTTAAYFLKEKMGDTIRDLTDQVERRLGRGGVRLGRKNAEPDFDRAISSAEEDESLRIVPTEKALSVMNAAHILFQSRRGTEGLHGEINKPGPNETVKDWLDRAHQEWSEMPNEKRAEFVAQANILSIFFHLIPKEPESECAGTINDG